MVLFSTHFSSGYKLKSARNITSVIFLFLQLILQITDIAFDKKLAYYDLENEQINKYRWLTTVS